MKFISSESIAFDRIQIMSWESFVPKSIQEKTSQQDLDFSSTSITSQSMSISFFYDPCQTTISNLAFYINPQRRPDIILNHCLSYKDDKQKTIY
ncbi:unnamed protein product [Rotaria sordida]|uniref:Uncharacterized protein n=2 Tax=Rotaria sordida TaxID=392033 RepID=A0A815T564_9BILA|nr:unnamed protein product [Rotaria sordida]CAF1498441.1 unnamed protein product [Rotaria sordida]CAF1637321.1 unnamed protein product [Rotaria sordida]CAF3913429.1 unnamed protein product [Rotaria sordida]